MNQTMLVTSTGLDELKTELAQLVNDKRPGLVDRLSVARSMGDLSENSDYQNAKEELDFTDGRISELEELIRSSQVVATTQTGQVALGNKVTVKINGNQSVFQVVGEWEADPAQKKISHSSPLGVALMGKKVGEQVEVSAPAGKILYTIVAID